MAMAFHVSFGPSTPDPSPDSPHSGPIRREERNLNRKHGGLYCVFHLLRPQDEDGAKYVGSRAILIEKRGDNASTHKICP